ncbi:hypothetical protein [Bradyrhizobium sp. Ai1a-2]|uniref:hypothetical protein n=1 Tax=Bradyrhizobium sp. Ai1a-2 TaxID=196490 RepID=UPI00047F71F8|nr:hypothetical protein [Bradyrhizobium sp. Ai1a-2]
MPNDKRELIVSQGVAVLKQHLDDGAHYIESDPALAEAYRRCETLAEAVALIVAIERAAGHDEALAVEIALRAAEPPRESLQEAARIMRALGYTKVVPVLRKLARRAKPRPKTKTDWARVGSLVPPDKRRH